MRWYEKVVTKFSYLFSPKLRKKHLAELRFHLKSNQELTRILEGKLNVLLATPLREREKQSDYMKPDFPSMRGALQNLKDHGNVLRGRIEVIDPSFPKARLHRRK